MSQVSSHHLCQPEWPHFPALPLLPLPGRPALVLPPYMPSFVTVQRQLLFTQMVPKLLEGRANVTSIFFIVSNPC